MKSFESLPWELLVAIFTHLPRGQLAALSTVSSHFRDAAQSCLYSKIDLWWDKDSTPPIVSLLRTLVSQPKLALHVWELRLDGNEDFYDCDPMLPPRLSFTSEQRAEVRALEAASPACFSPAEKQSWVTGLQQGTMDALVTLLVSLLPSLRSIKILNNFAKEVTLLGSFLRRALMPNQPSGQSGQPLTAELSHVKEVIYLPVKEFEDINMFQYEAADILPLFYLPGLRELSAWVACPTSFSWPWQTAPDLSRLEKLYLTSIRETQLEPILRETTRLKSFTWELLWDGNGNSVAASRVIDFEQFFRALSHVRGSLEDLTLRADIIPDGSVPWEFVLPLTTHGSMRPLKNYSKLRTVAASVPMFLGFSAKSRNVLMSDVLPEGIERVELCNDFNMVEWDEWTASKIKQMVYDWFNEHLQDTPCLQALHFRMMPRARSCHWREESLAALERLCSRFQLNFEETSGAPTREQLEAELKRGTKGA